MGGYISLGTCSKYYLFIPLSALSVLIMDVILTNYCENNEEIESESPGEESPTNNGLFGSCYVPAISNHFFVRSFFYYSSALIIPYLIMKFYSRRVRSDSIEIKPKQNKVEGILPPENKNSTNEKANIDNNNKINKKIPKGKKGLIFRYDSTPGGLNKNNIGYLIFIGIFFYIDVEVTEIFYDWDLSIFDFFMFDVIFYSFFGYVLFRKQIYSHQKLSLAIIIIISFSVNFAIYHIY